MKKCLILPYFGKFPIFFPLFLESCLHNKGTDFFLFTDQTVNVISENLCIVKMTWNEMVQHISSVLGKNITIPHPYKLCDFKPAYGYIFQEYISEYDYWGHCDCDLIFGNLGLLDRYFELDYDRIGEYGHLIFYKNIAKVNSYFKNLRSRNCPSWEVVSQHARSFCFDEHGGMNILCYENHIWECHPRLFDDIIFYRKNFYSRRLIAGEFNNPKIPVYFEYNQGELFRYYFLNDKWSKDESLYVHFQKRKMSIQDSVDPKHFLVIPNQFIPLGKGSKDLLRLCSAPLYDFKLIKIMVKYYSKVALKKLAIKIS